MELVTPLNPVVIVIGKLLENVTYRQSETDDHMASFTVVPSHMYPKQLKLSGKSIQIAAYGELAKECSHRLRKDSDVLVVGECRKRNWIDDAGQTRSTEEICASIVEYGTFKNPARYYPRPSKPNTATGELVPKKPDPLPPLRRAKYRGTDSADSETDHSV